MAKPLDADLRRRMVAAIEAGASCRSAASRFDVSESAAIKLMRRYPRPAASSPGRSAVIAGRSSKPGVIG